MSNHSVLVVDDDESLRRLLQLTLPRDGFEVVEASDGQEALDVVRDGHVPDLVLLDWKMPGRSGAEVLEELKERHPHVRVIVLTAETQPRHRVQAESPAADYFLTKPFSPLQLLGAAEHLLEQTP